MPNYTTPGGGSGQSPALLLSPAGQVSITNAFRPGATHLLWFVMSSLFSWARDSERQVYGWWGSVLKGRDGQFGSFLWRLQRAKLTDTTVREARMYIEEALAWLITDSVVDSVEVETGRDRSKLWASITFVRGDTRQRLDFASLWEVILGVG